MQKKKISFASRGLINQQKTYNTTLNTHLNSPSTEGVDSCVGTVRLGLFRILSVLISTVVVVCVRASKLAARDTIGGRRFLLLTRDTIDTLLNVVEFRRLTASCLPGLCCSSTVFWRDKTCRRAVSERLGRSRIFFAKKSLAFTMVGTGSNVTEFWDPCSESLYKSDEKKYILEFFFAKHCLLT
jgi:hypothetical protein